MAQKEKNLINERLLTVNADTERLFRINAGSGWVGTTQIRGAANILKYVTRVGIKGLHKAVLIINPMPFIGAPPGWADLSGWETVTITEDMIGKKIAQFKMIEVKATGDLRTTQKKMKDLVTKMGGIFEVLRRN